MATLSDPHVVATLTLWLLALVGFSGAVGGGLAAATRPRAPGFVISLAMCAAGLALVWMVATLAPQV